MTRVKLAAIDLGTVSSRMLCAEMVDGEVVSSTKRTVITDLGEGVDATGVFAPAAIERVVRACSEFAREAREFGARHVSCTLTSAARDVTNGEDLLRRLRELGFVPQVIPGEIEARLTFYGVAHDFMGERIAVADSGGGSTELVVGRAAFAPTEEGARAPFVSREGASGLVAGDAPRAASAEAPRVAGKMALRSSTCGAPLAAVRNQFGSGLQLECAESLDIGCRRVTERFFSTMPPSTGELAMAAAWMRPLFDGYWAGLGCRPERLVAVGGTVTSLVAMVNGLTVYDSSFVHLRELTIGRVEECIERMGALGVEQIAALPGIQEKRAPVILAGALIVRELMRSGGYDCLTVSENSLLAGTVATVYEAVVQGDTVIGWMPELSN